jgi:hypothetical protein
MTRFGLIGERNLRKQELERWWRRRESNPIMKRYSAVLTISWTLLIAVASDLHPEAILNGRHADLKLSSSFRDKKSALHLDVPSNILTYLTMTLNGGKLSDR